MSTTPLQPFPPLPLELKGEILSHCDADTLAKASSASLAFLELASPLLYRHITFVGPHGLKDFLTLKADIQVPALAPYLDLSLIWSITYVGVVGDPFPPRSYDEDEDEDASESDGDSLPDLGVPHRLVPSGASAPGSVDYSPLAIHSLHIELIYEDVSEPWLFFNPVVLHFEGGLHLRSKIREVCPFPNFILDRWTRLRELIFTDAVSIEPLFAEDWNASASGGFSSSGPVVLRFELSIEDELDGLESLTWIVEDASGPDGSRSDSSIGQVVIQVRSENWRKAFLRDLAGSPLLDRTTVVVKPAKPASTTSAQMPAALATMAT